MNLKRFFPVTIRLDDPETGDVKTVRVRIKRMSIDEASPFQRDFYRSAHPASATLIARRPDGPEQETRTEVVRPGANVAQALERLRKAATTVDLKSEPLTIEAVKAFAYAVADYLAALDAPPAETREVFVLDDDVVRARRLAEMTATERAAFFALDAEEEAFARHFLSHAIEAFVEIEPDQLFEETDEGRVPVVSGADVLRCYGGRADVLQLLLGTVYHENTLSAAAKKLLRSLSASARGSDARPSAAAGQTPEGTADGAGTPASAPSAAASAPATSPSSSSSDAPATETTA